MEAALNIALEVGYRLFDTGNSYGNERTIGKVLNEWISSGKVTRNELFVTTKVTIIKIVVVSRIKKKKTPKIIDNLNSFAAPYIRKSSRRRGQIY